MLTLEQIVLRVGAFTLRADLSVTQGRKVAVVGPSGAGKSTLVAAIAGFLEPEAGRITWKGQDLTRAAPGERPVAMLFQDGNLFPHLTVEQNVGLGIRPRLRLTTAEQARVQQALARVGLKGMGPRKPAHLSGGQQSRAALARVLVQDKALILLDEPFSALGPALKLDMLDLVAALADEVGATLIMVTHDPVDARRIADQVILVADGVALPPQETSELLDNPPPVLRDYLG